MFILDLILEFKFILSNQYKKFPSKKQLETIESSNMPIFIISGYKANLNFFMKMKSFFEKNNYPVYFPLKDSNSEKFEILVEKVIDYFEKLKEEKIIIIAHSMGGLILISAMNRSKILKNKIFKIITLSTPYYGSFLGNFIFFDNKYQILKEKSKLRSEILEEADFSKIYAFCGKWDNSIIFKKNTKLPKGETKYFDYGGHVSPLLNERTFKDILNIVTNKSLSNKKDF